MQIDNFTAAWIKIEVLDKVAMTGGQRTYGIRRCYLEDGFSLLEMHTIDANEYLPAGSQVSSDNYATMHKATR